jgi:2,4-dienoyl-CoA reductase-like NADH-dependent reductase (Old Yellow Enzyme family)
MKEAGFDGVIIHAGHGWLLHQFLSARTNQRTDEYGGSLENRAKFPIRVIKSVREALSDDFILEIRVSGDERIEKGMLNRGNRARFCAMIEPYVDNIHVFPSACTEIPILSGQLRPIFQPHA